MAIKLQIRKKTGNVWQHYRVDQNKSIYLSKFHARWSNDTMEVTEPSGVDNTNYLLANIAVYDDTDSGTEETFGTVLALVQRLKALGYTAFNEDGDVVIAELISTDSSNALELGGDGKLFVTESSGGISELVEDTSPQLGGDLDVNGNAITGYLPSIDEDNMASDSASYVPTQQSVKAYVDANAGASSVTIESDITANTTISGTQKGLNTIYPVNNASARTITVDKGTYVAGDVVNFMRKGEGAVTIDRGTNVRLQGARDINNVFNIQDVGGYASIVFEYLDGSTLVASVIGDIERGYTGPVTTSSYSNLESNETANVTVAGTGFSDNMLVTLSGNATLNSYTVNSNTSLTLNITSSGTDGDFLTVTYDNGQVFVDTNAIQLTDIAPLSVVIETTSTSATWSPTNVNNSGSTLTWTVTGDASGTYNANDPTIDLSGNVGTAIITITSADDLAGWTTARFTSLNITSADVSGWTACTELYFYTNGANFTSLTGTENLVNATSFTLIGSGFTSFQVPTGSTLTNIQCDFCINLTSITNLANASGLSILDLNNTAITSLDVSSNTALTNLSVGTTALTAITGLANLTNLTTLAISGCDFDTIDIDANNSLTTVQVQTNSLDVSTINNIIIDLDAAGLSSGTLNYSAQSPTANPTATEVSTDDVLDAYNALVSKSWTITGATPS